MPPKITPKNLHYDTTLPPFLQKLQSNYNQGLESRDGRHESALLRARPKRVRDEGEEKEDEPVYVDEEGNVVDVGELEGLGKEGDGESGKVGEGEKGVEGGKDGEVEGPKGKEVILEEREKEKVVEIGGSKKRKIGKVIGSPKDINDSKSLDTKTTTSTSISGPKPKKKKVPDKKKVKLSFGDDE